MWLAPAAEKIKISTFCGQSGTPVPTIYKLTTPYIQLKLNTTAKKHPFPTHRNSALCTYGRGNPSPTAFSNSEL